MKINQDLCTGCGTCLRHCPMKAITVLQRKARVSQERCAECGLCLRLRVCPVVAFEAPGDLEWPRSIRSIFSNPLSEFKETGVTGRGTEEMKTNDVTDRFKEGFLGVAVDVGRPNLGTTLRDVDIISRAVAPIGVAFEAKNPLTYLMQDKLTGALNPEVLGEAVVSAIVEFIIPEVNLAAVLDALREAATKIDTVFSVGVICRVKNDGSVPAIGLVDSYNKTRSGPPLAIRPDSKVNVGLGRV